MLKLSNFLKTLFTCVEFDICKSPTISYCVELATCSPQDNTGFKTFNATCSCPAGYTGNGINSSVCKSILFIVVEWLLLLLLCIFILLPPDSVGRCNGTIQWLVRNLNHTISVQFRAHLERAVKYCPEPGQYWKV